MNELLSTNVEHDPHLVLSATGKRLKMMLLERHASMQWLIFELHGIIQIVHYLHRAYFCVQRTQDRYTQKKQRDYYSFATFGSCCSADLLDIPITFILGVHHSLLLCDAYVLFNTKTPPMKSRKSSSKMKSSRPLGNLQHILHKTFFHRHNQVTGYTLDEKRSVVAPSTTMKKSAALGLHLNNYIKLVYLHATHERWWPHTFSKNWSKPKNNHLFKPD